jgi:hypothetical protein
VYKTNHHDTVYHIVHNETMLINHSIESFEENSNFIKLSQIDEAKIARKVYHALGPPLVYHFMSNITSNPIQNITIILGDINVATNNF